MMKKGETGMTADYGDGGAFVDAGHISSEPPVAVLGLDQVLERVERLATSGDLRTAHAVLQTALEFVPDDPSIAAGLARVERELASSRTRLRKHEGYLDASSRMPAAHIGFTGSPGARYDGGLSYDEWGFLNESLPCSPKPRDEYRIFIVGDSTMCGGSSFGATVPGLLQERLSRRGDRWSRVYNFSVVSTRATQMLALILHRLVDLEPDVILVCAGAAEVYVPMTYDPRPEHPYNFYVLEELYARYFDPARAGEAASTERESVMGGVSLRHAALRAKFHAGSESWAQSHVNALRAVLSKLDRVAGAWAIDTKVVLQPLVTTKESRTVQEENACSAQTHEYFTRQYARFRAILNEGSEVHRWGANLEVHDATDVFNHLNGQVYEDFVHYNDIGREAMADRFAALLADARSNGPAREGSNLDKSFATNRDRFEELSRRSLAGR